MLEIIKKNKEEIILGLIFLFFAFGFNLYRVQSDGVLYYSFLESILQVPNPENIYNMVKNAHFFQAGCAYFNLPFYLIAYAVESLFHKNWNFNGITLRQISINLASNFYILLSMILSIKILKKLKFKHTILPVISVLFSTTAFAAATVIPSFNHAADIFVISLFLYLFIEYSNNVTVKNSWLGVVYVIAILVRYSNFVLIFPFLFYNVLTKNYKNIQYFLIGFISFAWVIPAIFYLYNGSVFSASITPNDTATALKMIPLIPKYFLKLLVHPLHGLFIWSPVTIFSAIGLSVFPKTKEKLGYLFLVTWFLFLVFNGFFPCWYGGWSFSNRYLVSLFPIYVLGLAAFLDKYGTKAKWIVLIATLYSFFLFFNWYLCIMQPEFETPLDMIKAWVKGESLTALERKVNLITFAKRVFEVCRYKYLFILFK